MDDPQIGVFLPTMSAPDSRPGDVVAAARHAEDLGFESVWAVDQLVAGTGAPLVDSMIVLAAVAGATERVKLGLGVVDRSDPPGGLDRQAGRVAAARVGRPRVARRGRRRRPSRSIVGATGVPRNERGARTDAALAVLPDLIAGKPARLPDVDGAPVVELAPGATVPPILVGGTADAALGAPFATGTAGSLCRCPRRSPRRPSSASVEFAVDAGRAVPTVTGSIAVALDGDPAFPPVTRSSDSSRIPTACSACLPRRSRRSSSPGDADAVVERVAGWAALGADRVVFTLAAGDWHRQAELLADALFR